MFVKGDEADNFLAPGGEGARRCGDPKEEGGDWFGMVGFSLGEGGGRGRGGGGWLVLGGVGASRLSGPLKLWSNSSRLMSSRSVVARWRPPGKRFTVGSEAGEHGGESFEITTHQEEELLN